MSTATMQQPPHNPDCDEHLRANVARLFAHTSPGAVLFNTSGSDQRWPIFLDHLHAHLRQTYRCSACRHFAERFGGLVVVKDDGHLSSVLWRRDYFLGVPELSAPISALQNFVESSDITGPFYSGFKVLGTPVTGPWKHLAVANLLPVLNAHNAMAIKRESYAMVMRSLEDFSIDHARQALHLLKSGQLYRHEKCLGVAQWFYDVHLHLEPIKNHRLRQNLIWRFAVSAPVGFPHIRSGMIGTLLDDVKGGLVFPEIKRRFDEKMNPLQFMRPQAAPTSGNIARAEKIVEEMGLAPSLERRFARLDEVETIWRPKDNGTTNQKASSGVFANVKAKDSKFRDPIRHPDLGEITMTWSKFAREVLPITTALSFWTPDVPLSYMQFVTALHPEAPPIVQWDSWTERNPFSWYVYANGSRPHDWNLIPNTWIPVRAVSPLPPVWYKKDRTNHGDGVCLILDGAKDRQYRQGAGLFPELLRSELHEIRSTIEAFTQVRVIAPASPDGADVPLAAGVDLRKDGQFKFIKLLAVTPTGQTEYHIDRWD